MYYVTYIIKIIWKIPFYLKLEWNGMYWFMVHKLRALKVGTFSTSTTV